MADTNHEQCQGRRPQPDSGAQALFPVTDSATASGKRRIVRGVVVRLVVCYALTVALILLQGHIPRLQLVLVTVLALYLSLCLIWLAALYRDPARRRRARRAATVLFVVVSVGAAALMVKMLLDHAWPG